VERLGRSKDDTIRSAILRYLTLQPKYTNKHSMTCKRKVQRFLMGCIYCMYMLHVFIKTTHNNIHYIILYSAQLKTIHTHTYCINIGRQNQNWVCLRVWSDLVLWMCRSQEEVNTRSPRKEPSSTRNNNNNNSNNTECTSWISKTLKRIIHLMTNSFINDLLLGPHILISPL
jgi:hypothetical protein